jgi:hypothetical protein
MKHVRKIRTRCKLLSQCSFEGATIFAWLALRRRLLTLAPPLQQQSSHSRKAEFQCF